MYAKEAIKFALTASQAAVLGQIELVVLSLHQLMHSSHVTDALGAAGRAALAAKTAAS